MIPYGRHSIDGQDVDAVVSSLQSDWLTTGPLVEKFEAKLDEMFNHFVRMGRSAIRLT